MQVKSCVVLVFTNVLMPVLINARVDSLAFVPLLFKGEHEDFDSRWYDSVGDSLMLTAAIKMVVWPLRWPLLHFAMRVRARLLSASAATQVSFIVGSREAGGMQSCACVSLIEAWGFRRVDGDGVWRMDFIRRSWTRCGSHRRSSWLSATGS